MIKEIICIMCPKGCTVKVEYQDKTIINLNGYGCSKGKQYANEEFIQSKRILTSTVPVKTDSGIIPVSVKTDREIPLEVMRKAVIELRRKEYRAPVSEGDILFENILDTNANVIATGSI